MDMQDIESTSKADFYNLLGLQYNASEAQIRSAHLRLAREWHPDKHGNSEDATEKFKEIQKAAEVLRDPVERFEYDMEECIHKLPAEDYLAKVQEASPHLTLTASGLGLGTGASVGYLGMAHPNGGNNCQAGRLPSCC